MMRSQVGRQRLKEMAADSRLRSSSPSRRRWELKRVLWHVESGADISQASTLPRPHGLQCIISIYPRVSHELVDVPILQMRKARFREFKEGL